MVTLSLELQFERGITDVWRALTESDLLAKWMWANDFKPIVGHVFQFRGEPNERWSGTIEGEVLEVAEPHKLVYTWKVGTEVHLVTWNLSENPDNRTQVHLEQSGITDQPEVVAGFKMGQLDLTGKLEKVLAEMI